MKSFKSYIQEARKGGEALNPHISTYQALEPFKDDPDVFITFTKILKVGINPGSDYYTPNGVYTYPLKESWKMYADGVAGIINVPFAGKSPFVTAIRRKGKYVDDIGVTYNSKDFDNDIKKLYSVVIAKLNKLPIKTSKYKFKTTTGATSELVNKKKVIHELLKGIFEGARMMSENKTIGGQMWNITRIAAKVLVKTKMINVELSDTTYQMDTIELIATNDLVLTRYSNEQGFDLNGKFNINDKRIHFTRQTDRLGIYYTGVNETTIWSKIWLSMGYTSVADRSLKGIIHIAEPTQAVFFSPAGYDIIGTWDNKGKKEVGETRNGVTGYRVSNKFLAYNDFGKEMTFEEAKKACEALGEGWDMPNLFEIVLIKGNAMRVKPFVKKGDYWLYYKEPGQYATADGGVETRTDPSEKHLVVAIKTSWQA